VGGRAGWLVRSRDDPVRRSVYNAASARAGVTDPLMISSIMTFEHDLRRDVGVNAQAFNQAPPIARVIIPVPRQLGQSLPFITFEP
jgi:hypothetical protein